MDRKNIFSFFFKEFKKTPKICNSRLEYRLKVRWHANRAAMNAREIAEFPWTTFRPVFHEIQL